MLITQRGFRLFTDYELYTTLQGYLVNIERDIQLDPQVLTESEEKYIKRKVQEYKIDPLVLYPDKITVSQKEAQIPAEYFPSGYWVERGKQYPKSVLSFHLPFKGNPQWLRCRPSTFLMWTDEIAILNNEIIFEIINFNNDAEAVKKERDIFIKRLEEQVRNIENEISVYNTKLEGMVQKAVKKAKDKLKEQDDFLNKLGTPIK